MKIPWEALGKRLGKTQAACYKYFINTFCKNVMEPWPDELLLQTQCMVDELCAKAFPTDDFKKTKRQIIDQVSDSFQLRSYVNCHFDTLYFRMYNRVEKNYKDFEETHVNCRIPNELVAVYTGNAMDLSQLRQLAMHVLKNDHLAEPG